MKKFSTAPLPFMGQKRNFLKHFVTALENYPQDAIYVDLFGGSGLLSHTTKLNFPNAKVIWNDYDNYQKRPKNIAKTNQLLADFREILHDYPKDALIKGPYRDRIVARLEQEDAAGYVDYLTVSSSILFGMKYFLELKEFYKDSLYNKVKMTDYVCDGYLEGVERTSCDYRELYDEYKNYENVIFLVDPPYLSTDVKAYKSYWKLHDYLNVLDVLASPKFFYFTSNKSSIVELCEWVESKTGTGNPFSDATKVEMKASLNFTTSYTDIMLFK